jgi:hypothetical protein
MNKWAWCKCLDNTLSLSNAVFGLIKRVGELFIDPDIEKASDVVFAAGRLFGSVVGEKYVSIPGDSLTISKFKNRMMNHQCIRDSSSLVRGRCPSCMV